MEQDRFDDLTRALARGTSRRQALKLLGGSLAGGLLAFLGVGEAAADNLCKPIGKKCNKTSQCCGVANATVTCNGTCQVGACKAGFGNCDDNPANGCETPLNTNTNCGACGNACTEDQTCQDGKCVSVCPPSPACSDTCHCDPGQTCVNGTCCSGQVCGSTCCDFFETCCGSTCCGFGQTCVNGTCCFSSQVCGSTCCGFGQTCVDGTCVFR
jgi:hypothetical protein